jgi:hypothetical protein
MTNIIDLQEISPNHWRAKYQGNFGVYTIRISTNGKETTHFSCSCPSSYYPCKHIAMIEEAIGERIAKSKDTRKKSKGSAEALLKTLSRKELYDFIVKHIRYNPDLTNDVFLEFSYKIENPHQNKYSLVLRRALETITIEEGDNDGEDWIDIDVLHQWLEKAERCFEQRDYQEAVLIAQAHIEEFAQWLENLDGGMEDWIHEAYQTRPFAILENVVKTHEVTIRELFDYCMVELPKKKYAGTMMHALFNDLLLTLSLEGKEKTDSDAFIALQNTLLQGVANKSSYEAKKILQREIEFYQSSHKPQDAWKLIEENIQIPDFRKQVIEEKIKKQDYKTAKKLIQDFIDAEPRNERHPSEWDDMSLTIAKEEKDIPTLRRISRLCIDAYFTTDYFTLYKSTFTADEWADAVEDLLKHYEKRERGFSDSMAEVFANERAAERLLAYIEKHLSLERLAKYHTVFAGMFPEKTLALFRKTIDRYAEDNVGRSYYERIAESFTTMTKIPNGNTVVTDMINTYRIRYRKRRAMLEILNRLPFLC